MPHYQKSTFIKAIKRHLWLLAIACVPLIVSPAFSSSEDARGLIRLEGFESSKKVAILVGVENYNKQTSGFSSLNYAVDDVNLLNNTFKRQDYKVYPLRDSEATRERIINKIKEASKTLKNGDGTLVFSFSGHGFARGKDNYLATYDARLNALKSTALSVNEVIETIKNTGVKRAVLFVDACRNNPTLGARSGPGDTLIRTGLGEGIQVLYGTGNKLLSYEDPSISNGIFSHFINKGLNGKARRVDGTVDFDSLAHYVEREVPKYSQSNLGVRQQPWRGGREHFGDFILASHEKQEETKLLGLPDPDASFPTVDPAAIERTKRQKAQLEKEKKEKESRKKIQDAQIKRGIQDRKIKAKQKAAAEKRRNVQILRAKKAITDDHNLKKNALQIECRRKANILKTQFQKRMLDYDISLRQQLNNIPSATPSKQRMQAESRYKSDSLRKKRTLNDDNKQRQLVIQRECSDKNRLLTRKLKLKLHEYQRTLSK